MSREIKFKVWIKHGKRMVDVNMEYVTRLFYSNREDYILLQFTGLYDKNGNEIYDGDIVEHEFKGEKIVKQVEWVGGAYIKESTDDQRDDDYDGNYGQHFYHITGFLLKDIKAGKLSPFWLQCEIIGNKFENPELIK